MKAAEIRSDLLKKIEHMNAAQLKTVYGLMENYFNSTDDTEEWDALTLQQKEKIKKGIAQADAGNTKPLSSVVARLRKKYGLHG